MLEKRGFNFYKLSLGSVMQILVFVMAIGVTAQSNALNQRWCDRNPMSPHCDLFDHHDAAQLASTWKIDVFLGDSRSYIDLNTYVVEGVSYFAFHGIEPALINEVNPHDVCASFGYGDPADVADLAPLACGDPSEVVCPKGVLFTQMVHHEHFHHRSGTNWRTDPKPLMEIWCTGVHLGDDGDTHEPVKGGFGKGRNK